MNSHFIEKDLRSKLQSGEITEETVNEARRLAYSTNKVEHISLYSQINRELQYAVPVETTVDDIKGKIEELEAQLAAKLEQTEEDLETTEEESN